VTTKPRGPLAGLKVIDLSHIMAGPVCCLMLADMGADVIKLEKFPGGDDVRRSIPPIQGGEPSSFMMMNRNKRGIAVNLKTEGGQELLRRLLTTADVVVENFTPGTMERLGFGYEELRKLNPALIYCALSGFGRTGPYAERRGFDLVAQGMSGIMSCTGEGPGRPPVKCGPPVTDIGAGVLAAMGVLAAYVHRLKTGEGQMVDTSLLEAGVMFTYWQSAIAFATGESPPAMGSAHPLNGPYQAFPTKDGWVIIGAATQPIWLRLVDALAAPELAEDPRFRANGDRMRHLAELEMVLSEHFRRKTTAEWVRLLEEKGVPAGPVNTIAQMHEDPQVLHRQMVVEVDHTAAGRVKTIGLPVKFSRTPGGVRAGAPLLGEHTRDVLREYGYADAEIDRLVGEGAVHAAAMAPVG
jgi:crotonobetainyl-CoA:carnitine CoA-transferase CaiB-like acyl-CoA transferase